MRFQKMLRTQLIITGLGAALLLAGSVKAQENTNTEYSDGPYVVAFAQPAESAFAQSTPATSVPVTNEFRSVQAAAVSMPVVPGDSGVAWSATEQWVIAGTLFIALGVIMFYCAAELAALAEVKRANRSLRARTAARMSPRAV